MSSILRSVVLYLAATLGMWSLTGAMGSLIDGPSIGFTLGGAILITLMSFSFGEAARALQCVAHGSDSRADLEASLYFWYCVIRNLFLAGAVGTMIGSVIILQNLSDPESLGPSVAVDLLTLLYAFFFIGLIGLPAVYVLKRRLASVRATSTSESADALSPLQRLVCVGAFLLLVAIAIGAGTGAFIDMPSLIFVCGGTSAIALMGKGVNSPIQKAKLTQWQLVSAGLLITTLTAGTSGIIGMASSFSDPSAIGPSMAVMLLSTFYGLVVMAILSLPMEDHSAKAAGEYRGNPGRFALWYALPVVSYLWQLLGLAALLLALTLMP